MLFDLVSNKQSNNRGRGSKLQNMQINSKMHPIHRKKELTIETAFEEAQTVDLAEKDFKAAIINMFEVQKESMLKEL